MKNRFVILFLMLACFSCSRQPALITNRDQLKDIQSMLEVQKKLTGNSVLDTWKVFEQSLTPNERQALEFLYAYMPLSDLADYSPDFVLANVRMSLKAQKELPWGKDIPEDVFLHFVLPLRVNNENLDSFRIVMYKEIKDRVKEMTLEQAALEVNHWCHEKVVYRGTDERTSAPLSTIRKAFGRCGEESTFTVDALRAVGIPARQVYTPRWAHSDDNHAWVEVWIDGKWKFMGACEPDARLNMGWFSEPAHRTLLVHTRVYGKYFGDEDVVVREKRFSELNLTSNYAKVKRFFVEVRDEKGKPEQNAKVEFQLYNYAEYYPIATQYTDSIGEASISMGLGEVLVWASKGGKFAFQKISISETDTVKLILGIPDLNGNSFDYDFVPPHLVKDTFKVSSQEKKLNARRLSKEDSIRSCYNATFKDTAWSRRLARELGLSEEEVVHAIHLSYGNWHELEKYFRENSSQEWVMQLLKGISEKDFSDTKASILSTHLRNTQFNHNFPKRIFVADVLAPRVRFEMLRNWRPGLQSYFAALKDRIIANPEILTRWIKENIQLNDLANKHSRAPLSPVAVYKLRVADKNSRDYFFVAVCRSLGIPSRLNPSTLEPEYYADGSWCRATFVENQPVKPENGQLVLINGQNNIVPQYYIHFTLAKFFDGNYRTLEYDFAKKISDFKEPLLLEEGDYYMVTGNRLDDGTVLSSVQFFQIKSGQEKTVTVNLRKSTKVPKPIAKLDFYKRYLLDAISGKQINFGQLAGERSMVIAILDPVKEPSKHILNDLADYQDYFNSWSGRFVFIAASNRPQLSEVLNSYQLPKNRWSGFDRNGNLLKTLMEHFGHDIIDHLPLVLLTDAKGRVYMFSSGYKIGIGEQLLKIIPALRNANDLEEVCHS